MGKNISNTICMHCGAWSRKSCDLEDDLGVCPWEESGEMDEEEVGDDDDE